MRWPLPWSGGRDVGRLRAELRFNRELCQIVARSPTLQPILEWIVYRTAQLLRAEECCIKHRRDETLALESCVAVSRPALDGAATRSWPEVLRQSVFGYLVTHGGALNTPDLLGDPRFPGFEGFSTHVRALLAVPMRLDGRVIGLLAVSEHRPGRRWSRGDVEMLEVAASHAAGVLEMARLRLEAEARARLDAERRRMERELALARAVQQNLVPARPLRVGEWTIDGRVLPARQLGGDDYDYFLLGSDRAALVIADVMGKSVQAALLVFAVHGMIRALADGRRDPVTIVSELNRSVMQLGQGSGFVTLFYAELDARCRLLRYVNAGHNPPMLLRAGGAIERLAAGGLPVGVMDAPGYVEGTAAFRPADRLLMFSDGMVEARDGLGRMFGDGALRAAWEGAAALETGAQLDRLLERVDAFHGRGEQDDDRTLVVVAPCPEVTAAIDGGRERVA